MLTRPSRASSLPESSHTEDRKRKRNVLSCLVCRRRKLKCDRSYPACTRCVKGGNASSCTYQSVQRSVDGNQENPDIAAEDDGKAPKRPRTLNNAYPGKGMVSNSSQVVSSNHAPLTSEVSVQSNVIKSLEHRLATLEGMLNSTSMANNLDKSLSAPAVTSHMDALMESRTHLFKGRGVRTQYYGPSNPTSLLAYFPEVRVFMKDARMISNLKRGQKECNLANERLKGSLSKANPESSMRLIDLIPERSIVDRLVNLYFDTFETTYRILHRPTFWRHYDFFWQSPEQAPPGFIPSLLLVMASVRCMSSTKALCFNQGGSTIRSEAIQYIKSSDYWLTQQSQKHRFLAMYQVMCLRFLAAAACSLKVKQAYTKAEDLLNYFKAAGMHRDPCLLGERCSVYEMEMRRRLWYTVMEFELQASIDRGMPSSMAGVRFDCPPPLNINDENLMEESLKLPVAKPSEDFTRMSFLDLSSKSLALRVSLCSLINDTNSSISFDEVLKYDRQINNALQSIPEWKGFDTTQASTLLELQLHELLLLIHTPYARLKDSPQSRYSRMVCLETAKHLLDQHHKLMSSDNFTISLVRDDVYRAALSICHNVFLCARIPGDMFFQGILMSFPSMLDLAFKILEERCMRKGEGFQFYWHVSAAHGLVQSKLGNESFEDVKARATDRIAKFYHRVLAFQEGPEKTATITPSAVLTVEDGPIVPNTWFRSANDLGMTNNSATQLDYSDAFDYSDWTLDNFWPAEGSQIVSNLHFLE